MNALEIKLPYLTFFHRPQRGYRWCSDAQRRVALSPVFETEVEFISLVLSVDYHPRGKGWLLTEVQIRQGGVWSPFFKLALYSQKINHSFPLQPHAAGQVQVDVLQAQTPAQAYRFRLTLNEEADVPGVFVCLRAAQTQPDACAAILPLGERKISLTPLSQRRLAVPETDQMRLCSPTSLTMALNAFGVPADPLQTAAAVYDDRARIYGNWTLNTAYACRLGLQACVTRFTRLSQLDPFVNKDSLVLASMAYQRGELTGAAVPHTPGHLVVVCGWQDGQVWVADPAAEQTRQVLRRYPAEEFARAWLLNKRGAAYLVRKK